MQWQRKLKPGGRLVLGDILPPDLNPLTDAMALLRFGREGGFLMAALAGLIKTALSDYRKIRGALGLTCYHEADMMALLDHSRFCRYPPSPEYRS